MAKPRESVAIVGVTEELAPEIEQSLETLIFSTVSEALGQAGLDREEIGLVVTACSDQVDGRAISSMLSTGPAGGHLLDEVNLASSGAHAMVAAYLSILSGRHELALVTTWGKASEGNPRLAEHFSSDPYFDRDLPIDDSSAMAMQANAFRSQAADAPEATAAVVEKNRGITTSVTKADVKASPLAATPLRQLEISPLWDGACSLILASAAVAERYSNPVWIEGVGWAADTYRLGDRDLVNLPHLRRATEMACGQADRSVRDIDFFELHDYSADAEILAYAGLGLCELSSAPSFVLSGSSAAGGTHPVNLSGGSLSGEVPFVGAFARVGDLVRRLKSTSVQESGKAVSGLLQTSAGFGGQFQTVAVLGVGGRA